MHAFALGALCSTTFASASGGGGLVALDAAAQVPDRGAGALAQSISEGWRHASEIPAEGSVSVVVALHLPEAGVARLHSVLELGDPELRWGVAQLNSELSPPRAARDTTRRWLIAAGGRINVETSRFIVVEFDALAAERCFGVTLRSYVHYPSGQRSLVATESIHVPSHVKALIEFVAGLNRLPRLQSSIASTTKNNDQSAFQITPDVIGELYTLPKVTPPSSNIQGIAAFNNESFTPADLAQFQSLMHLADVPVNRTLGPATLPKGGTAEGSLDVQYMMGVSPHVPTVVWATSGQRYNPDDKKYDNEPFLKWIVNVSAASGPIPSVFSISYQDYEDTCPAAFMDRLNTEFAALAMRGTTLVTGSGDWGTGCDKADHTSYRADFPSSSPYVVSTGATTFAEGSAAVMGKEVGVGFSSGGFSNHFPMPAFQRKGANEFLAGCPVPRSNFNASGRGFPDVSAVGVAFQIVINRQVNSVGGTSAASPTFGAILSLINSERLSRGKKTIGWANPLLHAAAEASTTSYHDVTKGNNAYDQCAGFNATVGWDPMTGWGTPNFPELAKQLANAK